MPASSAPLAFALNPWAQLQGSRAVDPHTLATVHPMYSTAGYVSAPSAPSPQVYAPFASQASVSRSSAPHSSAPRIKSSVEAPARRTVATKATRRSAGCTASSSQGAAMANHQPHMSLSAPSSVATSPAPPRVAPMGMPKLVASSKSPASGHTSAFAPPGSRPDLSHPNLNPPQAAKQATAGQTMAVRKRSSSNVSSKRRPTHVEPAAPAADKHHTCVSCKCFE